MAQESEAAVIVNYSASERAAEEVVTQIRQTGGRAHTVKADVRVEPEVKMLFDKAEEIGPVKILMNNAGMALYKEIADSSVDDFQSVFNLNVAGTFLLCREAARMLIGAHFN